MRTRMQDLVGQPARTPQVRGFTLVELLVVIFIVLLVSAIALPVVYNSLSHRQVSEAGRILQGALVGARDRAIHDGQPSGLRLLPDPIYPQEWRPDGRIDPTKVLAYNRMVPIGPAPSYSEGRLSIYPDESGGSRNYPAEIRTVNGYSGVPCLVLEASPVAANGAPNPPTSWFWNIRVGDQIQINNAGPWYTIVGPMANGPAQGNAEMFVNIGPPGTALPVHPTSGNQCEYLLLVNGRDDNGNGVPDEGWDGLDNDAPLLSDGTPNPGAGVIDDGGEWERERWLGVVTQ